MSANFFFMMAVNNNTAPIIFFQKLKKDVKPKSGQRRTPGSFIRQQYVAVRWRLNEIEVTMPELFNKPTRTKRKIFEEEKWGGRASKRQKWGSKYFTAPGKLPSPQADNKATKAPSPPSDGESSPIAKTRFRCNHSSQKPHDFPKHTFSWPRWGGNDSYRGRKITLDNTCSIDNLLMIFVQPMNNDKGIIDALGANKSSLICKVLCQIYELSKRDQWPLVKIVWLHKICRGNDRLSGSVVLRPPFGARRVNRLVTKTMTS